MLNKFFPLVSQLHQNITVARFGFAPTSQRLSFEIRQLFYQLLVFQKPLSVFFYTPVSTEVLHFELIGPFTPCGTWYVMGHVSANVNVVRVWGPIFKVLVADFS